MRKLPGFLKEYFWDVDFDKIDPNKSNIYIAEKLLEYGDMRSVKWLLKTYGQNLIKKVIMTRSNVSPKTANFWGDMLNVPKSQIPSLRNCFSNPLPSIWDYQLK